MDLFLNLVEIGLLILAILMLVTIGNKFDEFVDSLNIVSRQMEEERNAKR
jgi:hypothetical protein